MDIHLFIGLLGLVPYYFPYRRLPGGGGELDIRALFWSLHLVWSRSAIEEALFRFLLVERLRSAIWAAVVQIGSHLPPQA